ncbi:pyridoxine biosynthesis protein [Emiliania huxleyi CCMP1516]|uniref:pyridoxal 5'-phosphate synthase (glutamine hydrolyzing) n=2 Tax=Emiliania huxleyi TaxID=2903 RepID=A0A0D3J011_EMIH1|nr:pyridoxine biosynthesis protein [Emiliania huxleyi CCMP1516]EOD16846.1 pyridoxine biosynthesis protein [Emiliania huxleyi CCMP1516]|eukprot:XP_005769275.1 pyridoxine biosynthesis protein [Emiliania huxleyi CCMP1516]
MLVAALAVSGVLVGPAARPAAPRSAPHALSMAAAGESFSVGVLALQGGFKEHLSAVERQAGVTGVEVRTPADLASVDALILPGGESTAQGHCIVEASMLKPLQEFAASKPVWGVCAGMILLADGLKQSEPQALVGGLHATIERNAFGRQIDSRFRSMSLQGSAAAAGVSEAAYFIRAPAVAECGEGVEVLATLPDGETAVAVRQDNLLATCFHPEISGDDSWLRFFLSTVAGRDLDEAEPHPDLTTVAPWQPLPRPDSAVDTAVKRAFAVFQQGGVIMDVVDGEQARIAEEAGAVAVMALERIPADIKRDGGVARSSDPAMIQDVMSSTSLPVMAKSRIGHFYEARLLEALGVDCIDESEVLTAADETHHIDKRDFAIPFVCAQDLGEALRRIAEGAAMIRLKGNAGTGNVIQAVRHARDVYSQIRQLRSLRPDEVFGFAKEHRVPVELVEQVRDAGRLPVVTFAAGGLATPADVGLLMELGVDGVFVGSGIFKGENPAKRAAAMVKACAHYKDPAVVVEASTNLGKAMVGLLEHEDPASVAHLDDLGLEGRVLRTAENAIGGIDRSVAA